MNTRIALIAALLPFNALAIGVETPKPEPTPSIEIAVGSFSEARAASVATSYSTQAQRQNQSQNQAQNQAQQLAATQNVSNGGNKQVTNFESTIPMAYVAALGTITCGAGVTAGGSGRGGAGALGLQWETDDCQLFKYAAAELVAGNKANYCASIRVSEGAKIAKKRGVAIDPTCFPEPVQSTAIPELDLSQYATREEMIERDKRIFERKLVK